MSENTLLEARKAKFHYVREHVSPYPERYARTHELCEAAKLPDGVQDVCVAGRVTAIRRMGKLSFVTLSDVEGRLQIAVMRDEVGEGVYDFFKKGFDIGDFMGAEGEMFTTKVGEKTLRAKYITFLGKAFRPLPEKFHSIQDTELCWRRRYLDLCMNGETRRRFLFKSQLVREIRRYLEDNGYIEIETPVLIDHPSGATARPFVAHHNALDMDVYLRIAPETYLKRAIVGGFTKVFEFARCFFGAEWAVVTFRELILKDCGIDIDEFKTAEALLQEIESRHIELNSTDDPKKLGRGNLIDLLYKKVSRPKMIAPTFLIAHPTDLSPLARANDDDPEITDRFQLVINGAEIINAYSELVDPNEQRRRLQIQAQSHADGDEEAMVMDDDYLTAMEYGMPPISGWGMGIDRVLQVLLGTRNIRDTVMFPLMRPEP